MSAGIDPELVARWLDRYVDAWLSYDAKRIGELFTEDAEYRFHPYDEPKRGRKAIVQSWLEDADEPGTYEASYRPVAIDGDVAVAIGTSTYRNSPGGRVIRVYDNCFVIRFDEAGRCREFTEYYVKRPAA
jgi:ketosteroid isomerase-like protein